MKKINNNLTVLLIEDNLNIAKINKEELEHESFNVYTAFTLEEADKYIEISDIIVIDINMPDGNGLDFCKKIKQKSNAKILFLTCFDTKEYILKGFENGANDYISKPYDLDIFIARVKALAKNIYKNNHCIRLGSLVINEISQKLFINNKDMLLTQKEYLIFVLLVKNKNKFLSDEYILKSIWNTNIKTYKKTLWVHISSLRNKLNLYNEIIIEQKRNVGYRIIMNEEKIELT